MYPFADCWFAPVDPMYMESGFGAVVNVAVAGFELPFAAKVTLVKLYASVAFVRTYGPESGVCNRFA